MVLDERTCQWSVKGPAPPLRGKVDPDDRPHIIKALDEKGGPQMGTDAPERGGSGSMTDSRDPQPMVEPTIVVVGMHRSGTSATVDIRFGLGLAGPGRDDLVAGDSSNERGHWESHEVQLCNSATSRGGRGHDLRTTSDHRGMETTCRVDESARLRGPDLVQRPPRTRGVRLS